MASDEAAYIRKTQEVLGALIKKPPLTDKLLSKPPFRFLHDVLMAVIKQTGFMDGLYEGDETDAQKVNSDKEAKIAFLQKAIDLVQIVNGEPLLVKPGKIVAGQEADRTNEFLQALAKAAKKGPNADVVKRVLKGEKANFDSGGSAGSNKENRSESNRRKDEKESTKAKESSSTKERGSSKDRSKEKDSKSKDDSKERKDKSKEKDGKEKSETKQKSSKEKEKSRSNSKTRDDEKKKKKEGKEDEAATRKPSSTKSASAIERRSSVDQPEQVERKRRSSKSAKSNEDKKGERKSDKSERGQSSAAAAAAAVDGERKAESKGLANGGEKDSKKHSSSSKRDKEKEKSKDVAGGLRIDLSDSKRDNGDIEIDPGILNGRMNGEGIEQERPRFASHSAKDGSRLENDDQEAASSLKTGGAIVRSATVRPSSAAGVRPGTASGRPGTAARMAPPRMKRQELGATAQPEGQDQITGVTGQIGQDQAKPPVVIQTETKKAGQENDDDDNFIVESTGVDTLVVNDETMADNADGEGESGDHGQLVRKILETKKELDSQLKSNTTDKSLVVFDAQEREKTKKEMTKLQEIVQQLTRTSHPLAKIVDFLQEDVDSMLKELQQWKEAAKNDAELLRQDTGGRTANALDIETLKNKSNESDQQITEQSEAITAIRGVILNNELRIKKLTSAIARK